MHEPIKVLDHGYVEFIESWGHGDAGKNDIWVSGKLSDIKDDNECGIVEAARQSTQGSFRGWDTDEKLLEYLYNNKHSTPFEFAGMVIEVQAPIFVFREWHRHRTQCLSGDTMICCVTPTDTTFKRSIRSIFDLKYGGVLDCAHKLHKNGFSKAGTPVYREARRKTAWRTRILPNCQDRILRVLNEETGEFLTSNMVDVWESGIKDIYLLDTTKGYSVRASEDHPFWTHDGWVKMKDIKLGTEVARMGKVAAKERPIPPALRKGIGVWTSMMRNRLIREVDRCYVCNQTYRREELILDHVIPVSVSLFTALDERNLKPACYKCSRQKTNTEQPSRIGMSRRGIRWERVKEVPRLVGNEMTYDIEVDGPHHNYVANDLVVHNSYNEMSSRYSPLPDLNYIPTIERLMRNTIGNKQAGTIRDSEELTIENAEFERQELLEDYALCEMKYQRALKRGVPKELARIRLPLGRYSRMRASANLRNWLAFVTLRSDSNAQWEIQEYSRAVEAILSKQFPKTYSLFIKSRDK